MSSIHKKERRSLACAEKLEKKQVSERIWQQHKGKCETMRSRQAAERTAARSEREAQLRFVVTFDLAKASLLAERHEAKKVQPQPEPSPAIADAFNTSVATRTPTQMARVEAIKKQMEEWRKRYPGRDFGREM